MRSVTLVLALMAAWASPAFAQAAPAPIEAPTPVDAGEPVPSGEPPATAGDGEEADLLRGLAERGSALAGAPDADDAALAEARIALERARDDLVARGAARRQRIDAITARLEEIGEPVEGEDAGVAAERARLIAERARIAAASGAAEEVMTRADEASEALRERRRQLFSEALLRRRDIATTFSAATLGALLAEIGEIGAIVSDWIADIARGKAVTLVLAGLIVLAGVLAVLAGTARLRARVLGSEDSRRPTYLQRVSRALATIVLRTIAFALFAVFTFAMLTAFDLLGGRIEPLLVATLAALVAAQFALAVVRTVLGPREPRWRLIDLDDRSASRLSWLCGLIVLVFVFDVWFGRVSEVTGAPLRVIVAENFIAAVVNGLALIAIALMRPGWTGRAARDTHPGEPDAQPADLPDAQPADLPDAQPADLPDVPLDGLPDVPLDGLPDAPAPAREPARHVEAALGSGRWPALVRVPLLIAGIGLIVAAVLGYIGLAQFMARQIVVTGAIIATMGIGILTARAISSEGALRESAVGRAIAGRRDLAEERYDQIGVLASLVIGALVLAAGIPLILLQWGFAAREIGGWTLAALRGIEIGSVTVSLGGILLGLGVFALGFVLTRAFQRWLDRSVLERGRVDAGVRNSVRTVLGYVCLVVAALIALSVAGLNLSSLAFVAGALSVGIGFGLQNVVSNFVSGLILLAERPFRVGDIVETGSTLGVIQRISVRSTTIETFTKQSVIVPNSDLINGVVSNWTLGNRSTRCDIAIGVSYDADPREVERLLLSVARSHPLVLRDPEPMIAFMGFGASSLDFELRAFLANVSDKVPVTNELSYRIFERLAERGIAIPFPQRDVNVRSLPGGVPSQAAPGVPSQAHGQAHRAAGEG